MTDDILIQEIQMVQRNNEEIRDLDNVLEKLSYPIIEIGAEGEWFFHLDPKRKDKKYMILLAECMDDRNTHNPLILLLSILRHFGLDVETLDQRELKALEIFAPLILNKTACAGPFTLRGIPREYYKKQTMKYPDVTLIIPVVAHLECGAHGKNNLKAILKRLQIVNTIYDWKMGSIVPVPLLSRTTADHAMEVLDSYDEVLELVEHFADKGDDLEELQTAFIQHEHMLKEDLEVCAEGRFVTELFSTILEDGHSAHIARFLELDHGDIREHHTKRVYTNLEHLGMVQYLLNPDIFIADYQHFHLDVLDMQHEENFDELMHEMQVALHYTNGEGSEEGPTFWHIAIQWDNHHKQEILQRLKEEVMNPYNPFAREVQDALSAGGLMVVLHEFDKNNVVQKSEEIEFDAEDEEDIVIE